MSGHYGSGRQGCGIHNPASPAMNLLSCACLADLQYMDGLREVPGAPWAAEPTEDPEGLERRWQSPPLLGFGTKRPIVLADRTRITHSIGSMRLGQF
jgi:hypothetical protein